MLQLHQNSYPFLFLEAGASGNCPSGVAATLGTQVYHSRAMWMLWYIPWPTILGSSLVKPLWLWAIVENICLTLVVVTLEENSACSQACLICASTFTVESPVKVVISGSCDCRLIARPSFLCVSSHNRSVMTKSSLCTPSTTTLLFFNFVWRSSTTIVQIQLTRFLRSNYVLPL